MKHKVRVTADILVDDALYQSAGPVDHLDDGSLDAPIVMAIRIKDACKNVEGVELVDIKTERMK